MLEFNAEFGVPHSYIAEVEQCGHKLDVLEYEQEYKALGLNSDEGISILLDKKNRSQKF